MVEVERRMTDWSREAYMMNFERLEQVIEDAQNANNIKATIQAIDVQNKMIGAYQPKIDNSNKQEEYQIEIE